MQQQQVSTLQIRALGALCRVLSQVWRERIALAIPRLHKVWTKYAANLFCAELEEGKKKHNRNMLWFIRLLFALDFLFITCASGYYSLFHPCFNSLWLDYNKCSSEVYLNTYVPDQMVILTGTASDIKSTTKTPDTASKKKAVQSNMLNQITRTKRECEHWHRNDWSWGNWQDQQQASVLHMACHFHSFHKENTKSVISHYLRLINNNPDMLNLFSAVTKT